MPAPTSHRFAAAGALVLLLAACSNGGTSTSTSATPSADVCPLTLEDAWVKTTDTAMTGAFGTLANPSTDPQVLASATSPVAQKVELHTVVDQDGQMIMQPVDGGFDLPAGGDLVLEPGGMHIMLMGLTKPVTTGETVEILLTCESGGTTTVTAQAKDASGGAEKYEPSPVAPSASKAMPSGSGSASPSGSGGASPTSSGSAAPSSPASPSAVSSS